jgi:hypothetical protein
MENSGFVSFLLIDSFFDDNDDNFRMKLCCVRVKCELGGAGGDIRSFYSGLVQKFF